MPTFDDYLTDKTTFPDDTKITLASGVETTLGELRGGYMRQRDYTKKTQDLSRDRDGFTREKSDFESQKTAAEAELTRLASTTLERLAAQRPASAAAPTVDEVEEALLRDPIARRLHERTQALDKKLVEIDAATKRLETATQQTQQTYWTDFYNRQLAALRSKDPELDTDALIAHAKQNGFRDLTKAYRDLTEDRRMEEAVKQARTEALKEGREQAKRELAQPVIPQRRVITAAPEGLPTNFDDAGEAAKRDPEILGILAGQSGA